MGLGYNKTLEVCNKTKNRMSARPCKKNKKPTSDKLTFQSKFDSLFFIVHETKPFQHITQLLI